jgi:hypothetical protein
MGTSVRNLAFAVGIELAIVAAFINFLLGHMDRTAVFLLLAILEVLVWKGGGPRAKS